MPEDIIEPVLKSVETAGDRWPVIVLLVVIGVIAYFVGLWLTLKSKADERRDIARKAEYDQRLADRKAEYQTQLERERANAQAHREDKAMIVDAFNKNSAAMSEFSGILRPMADTLQRIDKHIEQQNFRGLK